MQLKHKAHKFSSAKYPICFLAHDTDSPTNIGSFFRLADALGVEKIYLTGTSATPPNRRIKKTSRSSEKYVPYEYASSPFSIITDLKKSGYRIISLENYDKEY